MYRKGSRTERELMELFASRNYAVMRSAGSGRAKFPCPDLVVGNGKKIFSIECKSSKGGAIYLKKGQIEGLEQFSKMVRSRPLIGIRFNNRGWFFLEPKKLKEAGKYKIEKKEIEKYGTPLEDLI